jgi:transposase
MIGLPAGTRIWIAAGVTDLRRGFTGLSGMVQTALAENPFSGQVFVFRGRRGDLIKLLWWDGDGLCLFAKRLERGRFIWPQATNRLAATSAQLRSANGSVKPIYKKLICLEILLWAYCAHGCSWRDAA